MSQYLHKNTEENHEHLSQKSVLRPRSEYEAPTPEYEARVLTTRPLRALLAQTFRHTRISTPKIHQSKAKAVRFGLLNFDIPACITPSRLLQVFAAHTLPFEQRKQSNSDTTCNNCRITRDGHLTYTTVPQHLNKYQYIS